MRLESQVCSLELAKKLKELGVKQGGYFDWNLANDEDDEYRWFAMRNSEFQEKWGIPQETISAFTVAELGEMLPRTVRLERHERPAEWAVLVTGGAIDWDVSYRVGGGAIYQVVDKDEANARARMLVYLIEKGIVKL